MGSESNFLECGLGSIAAAGGKFDSDPNDALGLYPADAFRIVRGHDAGAQAGRHAAWYFANETVAVPASGCDVAGYTPDTRPFNDVRRWNEAHAAQAPLDHPPLVWIGAPQRWRDARVSKGLTSIALADGAQPLRLVARHPLNRAWLDQSSAEYFASQPVSVRGTRDALGIEARVLWPEAFTLGPRAPPMQALPGARTRGEALRSLVRTPTAFESATLWERTPESDWSGKAVLAFVLNGAQGDDDEAHAGHFAIATGRIPSDGAIGDWLANSIYALDTESEKGIIAAPVPLANYQADLNAGQSWYRPSWMLVAVLDDASAAQRVQAALGRIYRQFWRHQLVYYHPTDNCTSMSIDTLRALGLDVPLLGPTSVAMAWLGLPALIARERSIAKARIAFDYLVTERTRLLPALALEAVYEALLALTKADAKPARSLERELARDLAAIAWVGFPQFPSSRSAGGPPVMSLAGYRARLPRDRSKLKVVPVPARPFPEALRDPDLLPPIPPPSALAIRFWVLAPLAVLAAGLVLFGR